MKLGAGNMHVQSTCPKTEVEVTSGTMKVNVARNSIGKVDAKVSVGVLSNHSDLAVQQHENSAGGGFGFGFGSIFGSSANHFYAGNNNSVSLAGDIQDHEAKFNVGSGVLNINNE